MVQSITNKSVDLVLLPRLSDYKYLRCLYAQILGQSHQKGLDIKLYSCQSVTPKINKLLYPIEILQLLFRKKNISTGQTIVHIHWIEFLYRWGNRCLMPFLIPSNILAFRLLKRHSKNKIVFTLHNIVPHQTYWWSLEYVYFKKMLDISDCVFVHGALQKQLVSKYYDVTSTKIKIIRHGFFNSPKTTAPLPQDNLARAKLGISQTDVVLTFIGAVAEYKGISVLLKAMENYLAHNPDTNLKLIIAGEANKEYSKYLQKRYSKILNDKCVIFINKRLSEAELESVLDIADFGICPYTNATTPATLLDFVSHNLPIITTDDPNVLDIMQAYPLILSKRGDAASLADKIAFAYKEGSVHNNKMGKSSIDLSPFLNAWEISADVTLQSYYRLTGDSA